jgi:glycogen synthase
VCGPTPDGTREAAREYAVKGWIKYVECPERNLSQSRNLGIGCASGEIIAFIDDDAIAEPEWLSQLVPAFDDPQTGAAGGVVFDFTGYNLQYRYAACDRLGNAIVDLQEPAEEHNYPSSLRFPYVQGTNCAYRRETLVDMGGFDEEYEFYLDETDVCCRLIDRGLKVRQLPNAAVHHKFLPSHIRNEHRVTVLKCAVIKNKIYFSLINNHGHWPISRVIEDATRFIHQQRADLEFHVKGGRSRPLDLEIFDMDAERALEIGLARGLSRQRRTRPSKFFGGRGAGSLLSFPRLVPEGPRRAFVFLSQSYPSEHFGGNGRHTHHIAPAIAALGHTTHVITKGTDLNRVDLEDGVWVHRIVPRTQIRRDLPDGTIIPEQIWNYSATQLEEIYRISHLRRIDAVEALGWECEAIATVLDGRFPSATCIVTALSHWLETNTSRRNNSSWMKGFVEPMLATERYLFQNSPGIVSASRAIASSIEEHYRITFNPERVGYIPHGMVDMTPLPRSRPPTLAGWPVGASPGARRQAVLFVGRLDLRDGIDVLLEAVPDLLQRHREAELWITGDDTLEIEPGVTVRRRFESSPAGRAVADRVHFLGQVEDLELRWLYVNCNVFVSPSRFEGFGLNFVEAMMFSKPCVGCTASGADEVIADGMTGVLVAPGRADEVGRAICELLADPARASRMGAQGRTRYEQLFESSVIAAQRVAFLGRLARPPIPLESLQLSGRDRLVDAGGQKARFLEPHSELAFNASQRGVFVTFWKHDQSGIAEVTVDGKLAVIVDLYFAHSCFETVHIACEPGARVAIRRSGEKRDYSSGSEVIVAAVADGGGGREGAGARDQRLSAERINTMAGR